MKPLLVLDAYPEALAGAPYYTPWIEAPVVEVRVPLGEAVPPLGEVSGVVVTGSKASVVEPEPWMEVLSQVLRRAVTEDVPVLGCCFGHQLLARALFGPDAVRRRRVPEVGYPTVRRLGSDPVMDSLPSRFETFVSHEDEVVAVPGLEVLAETDACAVHALRVQGRRAWGVQFHVEYPRHEEARILWYRQDKHPELHLDPEALLLDPPDPSALARALFAGFLAAL